ncbi:MAG: ATP-binding protein, partial [Rhodobacteraceae bacterium]|nr:ATP-binding protein [Paracoccaceae bacterium]
MALRFPGLQGSGYLEASKVKQHDCIDHTNPFGDIPHLGYTRPIDRIALAIIFIMTRPDIKSLRRFTRRSDRELTPYFAGRQAELNLIHGRIEEIASLAAEGSPAPAAGKTLLVTGAPGAGKTALASMVWSQLEANGGALFLPVDLRALTDPLRLQRKVEDLLPPDRLKQMLEKTADLFQKAGSALPAALTAALGASGEEVAASILAQILHALVKSEGRTGKQTTPILALPCPIVLFIDEIQIIDPQHHRQESETLLNLHLGTENMPILPLLAGLADAKHRLQEAGLSRLGGGSVITLGRLSEEESALSAATFFAAHHLRGEPEPWARRVAAWSDGWAMHVHNTLKAIAEEMLGDVDHAGGNGQTFEGGPARSDGWAVGTGDPEPMLDANPARGSLDHLDLLAVRQRAADSRAEYYASRLSGPLSSAPELVARVLERIGRPLARADIERQIYDEYPRIAQDQPWLEHALPVGDVFEQMLRRGLVQLTEDRGEDSYSCPIPS